MPDKDKTKYSVQDVTKALDLLEMLADNNQKSTVATIAKNISLSKSKTISLLEILEQKGLVEHNLEERSYSLGVTAFGMAQHILKCANVIKVAHPIMEELARKLDEAIYITVMNNDDVLFLDMVDTLQQVKAADMVGKRFPFFTNAAGKVIKSLSSTDFLTRNRRRRAIPNPEALEKELLEIRNRGFAVDFNSFGSGLCTVAVVIRDYAGKVVCSLTLLAPAVRMLHERLESEVIPSMLESADTLSSKFGYTRAFA